MGHFAIYVGWLFGWRYISSLNSADEPQEGRNSCPLLRSCYIGSCHVGASKRFSRSIRLAVYRLSFEKRSLLGAAFLGVIWIRSVIQDLSGSWCIKETDESRTRMDSSVSLMHHDPVDKCLYQITQAEGGQGTHPRPQYHATVSLVTGAVP